MNPRDLVRRYAAEWYERDMGNATIGVVRVPLAQRGETAGKAFQALQSILTVLEEASQELIPTKSLGDVEDAIRKAFE